MSKIIRRMNVNVVLWCGMLGSVALIQPHFFGFQNIVTLFYYCALIIPCVLGMYALILLGLFDLSAGSTAALASVAYAAVASAGIWQPIAYLFALTLGIAAGLINWVLIFALNLPALLGTLITMLAFRGVALLVTSGSVIGGLPPIFSDTKFGSLPLAILAPTAAAIIMIATVAFLSRSHIAFRRLYQIGSNRRAAESTDVNIRASEAFAYVLCGLGSALVGLLQADRTLSASPLAFPNLALDVIAACIIGGMSLSGGRGSAFGCACGTFALVSCRNIVSLTGINVYWEDLSVAGVLLLAVVLSDEFNLRDKGRRSP